MVANIGPGLAPGDDPHVDHDHGDGERERDQRKRSRWSHGATIPALTGDTTGRNNLDVLRAGSCGIAVLALLALVGSGGCRRGAKDAPSCGAVGAKFLALAKGDLARTTPSDAMRRAVLDQLPAMRDSIVAVCTESRWTEAVRACLVQAADHVAFEACELQLTEAQRRALDRAARGEESAATDAH